MENHGAICSCPVNYIGDPFVSCRYDPGQRSDRDVDIVSWRQKSAIDGREVKARRQSVHQIGRTPSSVNMGGYLVVLTIILCYVASYLS